MLNHLRLNHQCMGSIQPVQQRPIVKPIQSQCYRDDFITLTDIWFEKGTYFKPLYDILSV